MCFSKNQIFEAMYVNCLKKPQNTTLSPWSVLEHKRASKGQNFSVSHFFRETISFHPRQKQKSSIACYFVICNKSSLLVYMTKSCPWCSALSGSERSAASRYYVPLILISAKSILPSVPWNLRLKRRCRSQVPPRWLRSRKAHHSEEVIPAFGSFPWRSGGGPGAGWPTSDKTICWRPPGGNSQSFLMLIQTVSHRERIWHMGCEHSDFRMPCAINTSKHFKSSRFCQIAAQILSKCCTRQLAMTHLTRSTHVLAAAEMPALFL